MDNWLHLQHAMKAIENNLYKYKLELSIIWDAINGKDCAQQTIR